MSTACHMNQHFFLIFWNCLLAFWWSQDFMLEETMSSPTEASFPHWLWLCKPQLCNVLFQGWRVPISSVTPHTETDAYVHSSNQSCCPPSFLRRRNQNGTLIRGIGKPQTHTMAVIFCGSVVYVCCNKSKWLICLADVFKYYQALS